MLHEGNRGCAIAYCSDILNSTQDTNHHKIFALVSTFMTSMNYCVCYVSQYVQIPDQYVVDKSNTAEYKMGKLD